MNLRGGNDTNIGWAIGSSGNTFDLYSDGACSELQLGNKNNNNNNNDEDLEGWDLHTFLGMLFSWHTSFIDRNIVT